MRVFLVVLVTVFMPFSAFSKSKEFEYSIFSGQVERVSIVEKEQFSNFEYDLMYLAAALNKNLEPNHFCLLGYKWPDDEVKAMVYWEEKSLIFMWSGRSVIPEEYGDYASSLISSPSIDLKKDVVERQDPMATSTYLRANVEGTLKDCAQHGIQYELKPFTPPLPKGEDDW
ncbi:hypothetical protein [Pseudomonas sp. RIT-PI-AD]|uniref:hypothetical protein n=1 Tax=Pseudomonas sp. RIT-PI-AD TaxID=3035294 RepID=UPI0021DA17DD|nr:hypothetical protein [Pseudomonas sp. RIT-PI-AD]